MLGTGKVAGPPAAERKRACAEKRFPQGPAKHAPGEQAGGNPCTGGAVIPETKPRNREWDRGLCLPLPKSRLRLLKKADGGGFFLFSKGIVRV